MCRHVFRIAGMLIFLLLSAPDSHCLELVSSHAVITYEKEDLLRTFNRGISLGSLSFMLRNRTSVTIEDEVKNKVDVLVERVQDVLDMRMEEFEIKVVLLATDKDVQRIYEKKYSRKGDYIAFFSSRDNAVYLSVDDVRTRVLAHEIAHAVINRYLGVPPSARIHEVLAQFVENNLKD